MSAANKVPPDGGYGWVVTFAYALNNVVVLPLITSFGLVFQEAFSETGITATQGALIITLNHGFGMLLSFFGGPVLRRFGYRKVAVTGALFISGSLMLTAASSDFWMFLFCYSILNSIGVASVMAAFSLAINSFFKEKRGRAIGMGMSITGLGAIFTPLIISALIYAYGWRYAVFTLGAICLHSFIAALLLRPAKWYLKKAVISEEMVPLNNGDVELINGTVSKPTKENGFVPQSTLQKSISMHSLASNGKLQARNAISHPDLRKPPTEPVNTPCKYKWFESQEINLASSINVFDENVKSKQSADKSKSVEDGDKEVKRKSLFRRFVDFFDLTLMTDPVFVNILFGMSIASCVETNFSLLFPIILNDMLKFETEDIAKIMAVIGFSDTLFRLVAPFIGEWCNKPPRVMYLFALFIVIFTRTIMLFTRSFTGMIFVGLAMGVTKGVRTVYMNVIIPSYVPLDRLPFASGIQMFFNGIIIISIGSVLGRVREASGSYDVPIIILNCVTFFTIVLWSAEFIYFRIRTVKKAEVDATV